MRFQLMSLAAGLVFLAACGTSTSPYGGGGGGGCTPTATRVCLVNTSDSPANLTITHGATVTWTNGDPFAHTVTSSSTSAEAFNSPSAAQGGIASGGTFSHTFNTPGTFNYFCQFHGADGSPPTGMHGTITVQ